MKLIRKYTNSDYSFPKDFDKKKIELIEKDILNSGKVVNNGKDIIIPEFVANQHYLTPRHFTENWENIMVELNQ